MTLIIILNAVFAAFVVVGIVGLHLYAIAKDHAELARRATASLMQDPRVGQTGEGRGITSDGPVQASPRRRSARRGRAALRKASAVSVSRRGRERPTPALNS